MGFFDTFLGGGLYSISEKDRERMHQKSGFIRYAFRYLGGHKKYPELIDSVVEISKTESPDPVMNVYTNQSSAGLKVEPGSLLFSIPVKMITNIENDNEKVFSGGVLVGGLGAILQETRYSVAIEYIDDRKLKQKVVFGTTMAVKSEYYFSEFITHLNECMEKHNTRAFTPVDDNPDQDDVVSQLQKLTELKDKGALTAEEFAQAKSKLLEKQ